MRAEPAGKGHSPSRQPIGVDEHSRPSRRESDMFGLKKKVPNRPFVHADGCKIQAVDPDVEIPWSYVGDGLWKAECVCTMEYFREPFVDDRVRIDPLDPQTFRHAPECEFVRETDPAKLRYILKVKDGYGPYWWVECQSCMCGWQVPHYARESVR
jgi:hypothetical protein